MTNQELLWFGICMNLAFTVFNVLSIGAEWGPIRRWYFSGHNGLWLMGAFWVALLLFMAIR